MMIQNEVSLQNNNKRIGSKLRVIIDSDQGEFYVGRSQYDSPEVDQEILIDIESCKEELLIGNFYDVEITSVEEYDLYGEVINS